MAGRANGVEPLIGGENYITWKIQCQGALMRDGLFDLVTGYEPQPPEEGELRA